MIGRDIDRNGLRNLPNSRVSLSDIRPIQSGTSRIFEFATSESNE
jgi:hypothetical protein